MPSAAALKWHGAAVKPGRVNHQEAESHAIITIVEDAVPGTGRNEAERKAAMQ